jgi:hypothetical protein
VLPFLTQEALNAEIDHEIFSQKVISCGNYKLLAQSFQKF